MVNKERIREIIRNKLAANKRKLEITKRRRIAVANVSYDRSLKKVKASAERRLKNL